VTALPDAARLDALQAELQARRSIFHLAHAAVSLLVGMVAAGTAARLFWDYQFDELAFFGAALIVAVIMLSHGFIRWAIGKKALEKETAQFAELRALRASLGLDDPNVLLPR
jgi:SNF family Na+-dependent transporter